MSELLTGGCQCGAVRFSSKLRGRASICHCRMCQKAFGGFYGPLVSAHDAVWTRGEPKWFKSSNRARRAFCNDCGTPLAYETTFGLELAIGAFDEPEKVPPTIQVNLGDKLGFADDIGTLPAHDSPDDNWLDFMAGIHSNQHPDNETESWSNGGHDE